MKNDQRILELRKKIEAKRKSIGTVQRFNPMTNCTLVWDNDTRVNLHTVSKDIATDLLVRLNTLRLSAVDLGIKYKVSGFPVEDWITDLKAKLAHLDAKSEQRRLDALEKQLKRLLSEEKKTELEVDAIADLI